MCNNNLELSKFRFWLSYPGHFFITNMEFNCLGFGAAEVFSVAYKVLSTTVFFKKKKN